MKRIAFALALVCFLTVPGIAEDLSAVVGVYFSKRDQTKFLTLRQDATFVLRQRKMPPDKDNPFEEFSGKYELNGETIKLILPDGHFATGELKANLFTDGQGEIWEKQSSEPQNVVRPKYKRWF